MFRRRLSTSVFRSMVSKGQPGMSTPLDNLFLRMREEKRAALIAYIPAGFPTVKDCHRVIQAFVDGGVDAIEIGFPYSDPVMDGPTIQEAAVTALNNGTSAGDVLDALEVVVPEVHVVAAVPAALVFVVLKALVLIIKNISKALSNNIIVT